MDKMLSRFSFFWLSSALALAGCSGGVQGHGAIEGDAGAADAEADGASPDTERPGGDADTGGADPADALGDASGDTTSACPGGFGCACAGNDECLSELCVEGRDGFLCTRPCLSTCPDGFECLTIASGTDAASVCVPQHVRLCRPCRASADCQTPSDPLPAFCLPAPDPDDGRFCGSSCAASPCPEGFACETVAVEGGASARQCVPEGGATCACRPSWADLGLITDCGITNEIGTCVGARSCGAEGLSACAGREAIAEVCNGEDDDCDGETDELDPVTCATTNAFGSCEGVLACGAGVAICDAPEPALERCNGEDDDCDGETDELSCDDGLDCTEDRCASATGACSHTVTGGSCVIDGACYAAGAINPVDPCALCQPSADAEGWSAASDTCTIDGACYASGVARPGSPCEVCRPEIRADAWTALGVGEKCDDGDPCTHDELCTEGGLCVGVETPNRCVDQYACTLDTCVGDGTCAHTPLAETCLIDGACWSEGADSPDNACLICLPAADPLGWSPASTSAGCDDASLCTLGDHCDGAGACVGSELDCDDGLDCTGDTCDPVAGCVHEPQDACVIEGVCVEVEAQRSAGEPCVRCLPEREARAWSIDAAACFIEGVCVGAGELSPASDCQRCSPELRQDGWSPVSGGSCAVPSACLVSGQCAGGVCVDGVDACDDGRGCTTGSCNGDGTCATEIAAESCLIAEACYGAGVVNPDNACEICAPSVTQGAWSPNPSTCVIEGTCRAAGERAPGDPCRLCDPSAARGGWSLAPVGDGCDDGSACSSDDHCDGAGACVGDLSCDDGLDCTTDLCALSGCVNMIAASACVIDGACHVSGEDPGGPCLTCQPALSQAAWTPAPAAAPCDDGSPCSSDDHCDGAGSCVGDTGCDDGLFCTNDACTEGGCTHGTDLAWCVIDGACYGAGSESAQGCLVCDPARDQAAWSAVASGEGCDDGSPCSVGEVCDGAGSCVGDTSCGDDFVCTIDSCDPALGCVNAIAGGWCLIGGRCYDDSATVANGCAACVPGASQTSWTSTAAGVSCDTGDPCTQGASCDGAGQCRGDSSCDDGDPCTIDQCTASGCDHSEIASDRCVIGGICYGAGPRADNPCLACVPTQDQRAWTPRSSLTSCNDGSPCSSDDHCDGEGSCVGDTSCGDGVACTDDLCTASGCDNPISAGTCYIDGVCHQAGQDPLNACRLCAPATSATAWSFASPGADCDDLNACSSDDHCDGQGSCVGDTGCDDGAACTVDRCTPSGCDHSQVTGGWCRIDGACFQTGANPSNICEVCSPAQSTGAWTPAGESAPCSDGSPCSTDDHCDGQGSCTGDTRCDDGVSCTVDRCTSGGCDHSEIAPGRCLIDGQCYAAGARPGNPCQLCVPDLDPRGWTDASSATDCDDGDLCSTDDHCDGQGSCGGDTSCNDHIDCTADICRSWGCDNSQVAGGWCRIGGVCVANGAANPDNTCERCDASLDTTGWTFESPTKSCDDGNGCSPTSACDGAGHCVGDTRCVDGLSCTSDICYQGQYCQHPVSAGCLIDAVCRAEGATKPGDVCYHCDPQGSGGDHQWSYNDGATCVDGSGLCTTDDRCSQGICQGTYVTDAREPNESSSAAWYLGSKDDDMNWPSSFSANLYGPNDIDWFRYHVDDTWTGVGRPRVRLKNIPAGMDYDLCLYLRCTDGDPIPSVDCPDGTSFSRRTIGGASLPGCCSAKSGQSSEDIYLGSSANGGYECDSSDDDYNAWIYVYRYSGAWTCDSYSLDWGDD